MSYEYFLSAYTERESENISTKKILQVLEQFISKKDENAVELTFDEINNCCIYLDIDEPFVNGMMISRPCGGEQFIKCLYRIMQLGNFVFFEPDGKRMIALNPDIQQHLPEDMIESLGEPLIATDGEIFLKFISENR